MEVKTTRNRIRAVAGTAILENSRRFGEGRPRIFISFIRYQGDIQLSALVYASHQTTYHIFYYWLLYTLLVKP
jgi:hypothetical protein